MARAAARRKTAGGGEARRGSVRGSRAKPLQAAEGSLFRAAGRLGAGDRRARRRASLPAIALGPNLAAHGAHARLSPAP
jgi:hypothetical protein